MNDRRIGTAPPIAWILALVGVTTLFAVAAVCFATRQSVWTDEATQLTGLNLNFVDQLRWLTGRLPHAFTVPPDRTPPLSYWLGTLWTQVFGNSELTARALSISFSVASVVALWAVARQFLPRQIAIVGVFLLAFSPNFIVMSAEIRAYAAFIFFSIALVYAYLRLLAVRSDATSRDFWAFALAATLCSCTHFFGIVISGGAFFCLCVGYVRVTSKPEKLEMLSKAKWPLLFYLIAFMGIIPFVISAVKLSGGGDVGNPITSPTLSARFHDLIKLIYRFFSHESMLGLPGLSVAALIAGLTLVVVAITPGSNRRAKQLVLFLFVNLFLVSLIDLATHAFNAFSATYNVWALPVIALLGAAALTHRNRHIRIAGALCVSVLVIADSYATLRLSTAGEIYGHTRSTVVKTAVKNAGANDVVILYGNDAPSIYFALMYDYAGRVRQFVGKGSTAEFIGPPATRYSLDICELNAGTLLIADDSELSADALQFLVAHPEVHTQAYRELSKFLDTHREDLATKWTLVSQNEYIAQSALALAVFKSRPVDSAGNTAPCGKR
jgi:4-amino-4-deoxy-L-arabinose transferase-like glycosyltransferase